MSLNERDKMEIAEVVLTVLDARLDQLRSEIIAGFVETIDWHNDNFAKIMAETNGRTLEHISKQKREVIEVQTQEYKERMVREQQEAQAEALKHARMGFKPL